jgi:hypothetical protein
MSRSALTTSDSPQKAENKALNRKNKKSTESIAILGASLSGKVFKNLTAKEKDDILEALALRAGLIDPE